MDADQLLDGLNEAQARAVTSSVVPMCILAGAGSGKTRVLTRRIAYRAATGQHDPQRVLALTFTRKAAGELTNRLRQLGLRDQVVAGTFHAVAYAQLRARWADRGIDPPALLDRKVGFVARLLPGSARSSKGGARDTLPLDVVAEIEWAKARRVGPEQYPSAAKAANRKPPLEPRQIAAVLEAYEAEKRKRRLVDFDDLLSLCVRDLTNDAPFADAQRWRYRHFFVDEYQDVNPLQQALLDAWLGDRTDLCVVGDPNQAIYAWNGADARFLTDFTQRWRRGEVVRLSQNYRSSPQILAVANAVLGGSLASSRAADRGDDIGALEANRPAGPIPGVRSFADDKAEARAIARSVRDHHAPGSSWSAQAILVRTNAQTTTIEAALQAVQIPFRVKGGSSLLEQPEIKGALRDLRTARDDFATALTDLETAAARLGAPTAPDDTAGSGAGNGGEPDPERTGLSAADEERRANLEALVRLAHDYAAIDTKATVTGFLAWLNNTARADQPDALGDAVEIATFHAAKGLEWPVVHLAGVEQGLVPIGHAQTPLELAEERRLFYVAVTRAERELSISWSQNRTFGTRTVARDRSPYLQQVEAACDALARDEVPEDWAAYFKAARADATLAFGDTEPDAPAARRRSRSSAKQGRAAGALSDLSEQDQELFEALKTWRAQVAKAAAVPAFVVFHDATLQAIASRRPTSAASLTSISGLGPVKVGRYGDDIIKVVSEHS